MKKHILVLKNIAPQKKDCLFSSDGASRLGLVVMESQALCLKSQKGLSKIA